MILKNTVCSCAAIALLGVVAGSARATIGVDGFLDAGYGSPLAIQTINTGFGVSTVGDGTSAGGSELDAAYGMVQSGNLYLFLAGNFENNGNHINLFVSDGRPGQSALAVPATGSLQAMNGSTFSPGFQATLALDLNDYANVMYIEEYTLAGAPAGGYIGNFGLAGGIGTGSPGPNSIFYGMNNTHVSTMGSPGTPANPAAMVSTMTGLEVAIPLSLLGNPSGNINVLADVNGGSDGYLSNQFLPGLAVGTGNVGGGGPYTGATGSQFNFGATPGEFFTVQVPEPSCFALLGLGVLALCRFRRHN